MRHSFTQQSSPPDTSNAVYWPALYLFSLKIWTAWMGKLMKINSRRFNMPCDSPARNRCGMSCISRTCVTETTQIHMRLVRARNN